MTVKIVPNERGNPPGKLCDAELHFDGFEVCAACDGAGGPKRGGGPECTACDGEGRVRHPLAGLKLIGFAVWERRSGGGRNVTFPARQYSVNGERRSFALLRPLGDVAAQERIRDLVLQAYADTERARSESS